jgi:hypothetical protein
MILSGQFFGNRFLILLLVAAWFAVRNYKRDNRGVEDRTQAIAERTSTEAGWVEGKLEAVTVVLCVNSRGRIRDTPRAAEIKDQTAILVDC